MISADHRRNKISNHVVHTFDIDVDNLAEFSRLDFPKGRGVVDEGSVIDQEVRRAKFIEDLLGPAFDLLFIRDVNLFPVMRWILLL